MISKPPKSIDELFDEGTPIDRGVRRGVAEALRHHKQLGHSIAVWRNGRVVVVPAEQIEIPSDDDSPSDPANP